MTAATTHPWDARDFRPNPRAALTAHAVNTGQRVSARARALLTRVPLLRHRMPAKATCASAPGLMRRARLGKVSSAPVSYSEAIQFDL
jgi:hypothetical protein